MKILQICAYAAPYGGNFIKSLIALSCEAAKENIQTIYCFPELSKELEWCKILSKSYKVYYVPLAHARVHPKTYLILKRIFRENPDIVYAHSHFELYDTPLALVAPKRVKIFWHLHDAMGTYLHGIHKYIWKIHYSWFSKRAILLSVSKKHMKVVSNLGFNAKNAYYEPNAIDTERIKRVVANRKTTNDFLIFGWDYYRKGVDLAKAAVAIVKNNTTLGIVGLSKSKNEVFNGYTYNEIKSSPDINSIYASTKCFLHLSRGEGLSYALLEAIYSGLPVIVSDIEENLIASDFPTTIMVRNEEVSDIVNAMKLLQKTNYKMFDGAIIQSRNIIEQSYSIKSWAKRILSDYKCLELK